MPETINLSEFENVLDHYLFLKSGKQLSKLDSKFVPGKAREMTASQLQRCWIDTAFALMLPKHDQVLHLNVKTFVMILINIEAPAKPLEQIIKLSLDISTVDQQDPESPLLSTEVPTPEKVIEKMERPMNRKDFTGVKELFTYFTFNRSCNLTTKTKEQGRKKFGDSTFKPEINKSSNDIATTLMNKYWG